MGLVWWCLQDMPRKTIAWNLYCYLWGICHPRGTGSAPTGCFECRATSPQHSARFPAPCLDAGATAASGGAYGQHHRDPTIFQVVRGIQIHCLLRLRVQPDPMTYNGRHESNHRNDKCDPHQCCLQGIQTNTEIVRYCSRHNAAGCYQT